MSGSLLRVSLVAGKLMRGNRILLILMLVWPCVLTGIVLASAQGHPAAEDVASILEQELFYGLALVGLGASLALGTEQRANRTQQVLSRAVGRGEYLLALGLSAYLAFAGYVLVWLLNAVLLSGMLHQHAPALFTVLLAELSGGVLLCGFGLLWSVVLPQMFAAGGTSIVLGLLLVAGMHGFQGVAVLFGVITGSVQIRPSLFLWGDVGQAIAGFVVLVVMAVLLFTRKDL